MALEAPRFHVLAGVHPGSDLQKRLVGAGIESRAFNIGNLSLLNPYLLGSLVAIALVLLTRSVLLSMLVSRLIFFLLRSWLA